MHFPPAFVWVKNQKINSFRLDRSRQHNTIDVVQTVWLYLVLVFSNNNNNNSVELQYLILVHIHTPFSWPARLFDNILSIRRFVRGEKYLRKLLSDIPETFHGIMKVGEALYSYRWMCVSVLSRSTSTFQEVDAGEVRPSKPLCVCLFEGDRYILTSQSSP